MATPNHLTKFKDAAQARALTLTPVLDKEGAEQRLASDKYVEGYAAKYDAYLLYDDGVYGKTYERFEPGCFDDCDMSDIIMQFDHHGRVFARGTNGTLIVEPDDVGLFIAADLDKTDLARGLYDDISAGMITKMSWRFRPGEYRIERVKGSNDVTIVHTKVKKIYDVSAVSIPANDDTEINARSWVDGVIAQEARRDAELDERRRRLRLKIQTHTNE